MLSNAYFLAKFRFDDDAIFIRFFFTRYNDDDDVDESLPVIVSIWPCTY